MNGKAEEKRAIGAHVARERFKMNPSPDEWKRDGGGNQAAPHDQPVRCPPTFSPAKDEAIRRKFNKKSAAQLRRLCPTNFGLRKTCHPLRQYMRVGGRWSHIA